MYRILFVCHGNICRSPMAESVMADLIERNGYGNFVAVSSAAAHTDEIGSPPHRGTVEILRRKGVPLVPHIARLMTERDGEDYDLLIGMDRWNVEDMKEIVGEKNANKAHMLLEFSDRPRSISDPWYTGNFDDAYRDIAEGCEGLIAYLRREKIVG